MKKILLTAAALLLASVPAFCQPNGTSPTGAINHAESRNGRQPDGQEKRAATPEMMSDLAQQLRQMNVMIQKMSDTLEHTEALGPAKIKDVSRIMDDLSDVMRQMSDQIAGRPDAAGLQSLKARLDKLYTEMAAL